MPTKAPRPINKLQNTFVVGLSALILMAAVGFSYREWREHSRANTNAARSRATVDSVDRLLESLLDAESGQWGFLLSGRDEYLEPYNRAIQEIPSELSAVSHLVASQGGTSANVARLSTLIADKLAELHDVIELRRTRGFAPSLAIVLSDRGKQTMDQIRATCDTIRQAAISSQSQASAAGEAAAGIALLATVSGTLMTLFLFAFRLEPFASPEPRAWQRPWPTRYGAGILAVLAITLLRAALTPLIGSTNLPFTLYFCAVSFAAWFGGFQAAVLSTALSLLAGSYFFATPTRSLWVSGRDDQVAMLMIIVVGFGMALLSRAQHGAVDRALRAEISERDARQRFETTLASIGDAVITTDPSGKITLLNAAAESLTGWANEDAVGKRLEQVFVIRSAETGFTPENPVTRALREGHAGGFVNHTLLITKDGRSIPIDDSAAPIREGEGTTGVVLVFRDISARTLAEERLRAVNEEVRRTAHLLEPVACFVLDLTDKIIYWNPGAAELYGFSADEAIGQDAHSLLKTEFPVALDEILAQLRTVGRWDGELVHKQRDGLPLTVASHWALHKDNDGRPAAILEVNLDITERKEAERNLRIANAALSHANDDLKQFAFAASHDLREPLRTIMGYSQMLMREYPGPPGDRAAMCMEFITEGIKRMQALLDDLLAYTQLTGDGPEERPTPPVDLNEVLAKALENCKVLIEETRAVVTSDGLPIVSGHEAHFIQLFQNLINNALKYRSDAPPRLEVSAARQGSFWRLAVSDNGLGIAPEYHQEIFGVFKRLHGRSIPGTGIGLAICKRVVERYGGRIWVESQPGQGAIFYFTLPGVKDAERNNDLPLVPEVPTQWTHKNTDIA